MENSKTNAVRCSECNTVNPKFYNKCVKCGKKLDLNDVRIFDAQFDQNQNSKKWTPTSFLIFVISFCLIFFFVFKFLGVFGNKSDNKIPVSIISKTEFISKVKENQNIKDADITDVSYLYIAVVDDGTNKDAMAVYYCRLAKQYNISEIKAVKIIDISTANLPKNGTASGRELGKSFCE